MFQTNYIMAQENISYLYNKKEYWLVLLEIKLFQLMDKLRPKTGNPLAFFWGGGIYILLILCIHNVSNKTYHNTEEKQICITNRKTG